VFPLHSLSGSVYLLAAGLSWIQGKSPFERLVQLNSRLYRKLHPPSPSLATSYARTAPCIRRVPQARSGCLGLGFGCPRFDFLPGSWVYLFLFCHRERTDPIFSFAPNYGASGRAARFVRPVRFAGVEGSAFFLSPDR